MKIKRYLRRKTVWLYAKIVREKASPEYIARGWAIGMFFGCLSPFGAQLIFSIPTALLLKGSKIGATLGTLLTNHFTIFIIYPAQCFVGNWLLRGDLSYAKIRQEMHAMINIAETEGMIAGFRKLLVLGWEFAAPFFVGGALLTAIMTPLTYCFVKRLVVRYRSRKAAAVKELR